MSLHNLVWSYARAAACRNLGRFLTILRYVVPHGRVRDDAFASQRRDAGGVPVIGVCASFAGFRVICPSRVGVRRAGPPLPQSPDRGGGRLASIIDQEGYAKERQHHEEDDQDEQKEVGSVQNPKHERWDAE